MQSAMLVVELQLEALFQPAQNNSRFPWKRRIDLRKKAYIVGSGSKLSDCRLSLLRRRYNYTRMSPESSAKIATSLHELLMLQFGDEC